MKRILPYLLAFLFLTGIAGAATQTNYLGTVFIADPTTPTQQMAVNPDGSLNVTCAGCTGGPAGTNLTTNPLLEALPNDTSTGTVNGKLVKLSAAAKVITTTVADTTLAVGVCFNTTGFSCGISGSAAIAIAGQVPCVFDGSTTAGDWVIVSTTAAGDCHDSGTTVVPTSVEVVGVALTSNVGAGTYQLDMDPLGIASANNAKINKLTCADVASASCLNVNGTFTASQRGTQQVLALSGATATPNFDTGNNFTLTLVHASCPCTLANPSTTPVAGQSGVIRVVQSATGSDTLAFGTSFVAAGGIATIALSSAANAADYLSYYVADSTHVVVSAGALNVSH